MLSSCAKEETVCGREGDNVLRRFASIEGRGRGDGDWTGRYEDLGKRLGDGAIGCGSSKL